MDANGRERARTLTALLGLASLLLLAPARVAAEEKPEAPPEIPRARLDAARADLLAAFVAPVFHETDPALAAAERAREEAELATLRPVEATFRVFLNDGAAPAGVTLRGVHPGLDLVTPTVPTDDTGSARLRLPPGTWHVDLAGTAGKDRVIFGRAVVRVPVAPGGPREFDLPLLHETKLRFRDTGNAPSKPERVDLATEDLVHRHTWRLDVSHLTVLRPSPLPFVVQILRVPTQRPGYLLRQRVDGAEVEISARVAGATRFLFAGSSRHAVAPTMDTMDALSSPFEFRATGRSSLVIHGMSEVVVRYEVDAGGKKYRFYDTPIAVDGKERTFTGRAPFDVSVGARWNSPSRYNAHRYTVSIRVFLRDENGLIMIGHGKQAPFPVAWRALLDGKEHAQGNMTGGWSARLPKLTKKEDFQALRFALELSDTGKPRRLEVPPGVQKQFPRVGRVQLQAMPQLEPNARAWCRWANDLADSFRDATHIRLATLTYAMWVHAMPGLSGWGGWNGNRGWGHFSDGRLFGFARPPARNDGTVSHEMTHGHHIYAHGTYFNQVQSRAVRRMKSLRRDEHRVPAGLPFREWLDGLPETVEPPTAHGVDAIPVGSRASEDGGVGEDELIAWYLRQTHGSDACVKWRYNHEYLRWWLTLNGFSDDEARAGVLGHFTKRNLAWLIRRRGGAVSDRRAQEAYEVATHPKSTRPVNKTRNAAVKRWKDPDLGKEKDLDAALARMEAELGQWSARARVYLDAARLTASRDDRDGTKRHLLDALRCNAHLGRKWFDQTLADATKLWARARR